jgi:hypothetical protein
MIFASCFRDLIDLEDVDCGSAAAYLISMRGAGGVAKSKMFKIVTCQDHDQPR